MNHNSGRALSKGMWRAVSAILATALLLVASQEPAAPERRAARAVFGAIRTEEPAEEIVEPREEIVDGSDITYGARRRRDVPDPDELLRDPRKALELLRTAEFPEEFLVIEASGALNGLPVSEKAAALDLLGDPLPARRRIAVSALGHEPTPDGYWKELHVLLTTERDAGVLLAAACVWTSREEESGIEERVLAEAVGRMRPGAHRRQATAILAKQAGTVQRALPLFEAATDEGLRNDWSLALTRCELGKPSADAGFRSRFECLYVLTSDSSVRCEWLKTIRSGDRPLLRSLVHLERKPTLRDAIEVLLNDR